MLTNYLRIAYRSLLKHRAYTFINVAGLAVGMAACLLILLYVQDELGYDAHHENSDRIYRVSREWLNADGTSSLHAALVDPAIGPLLKQDLPEVSEAVRLSPVFPLLGFEAKHVVAERFFWTDPAVFDVFTIPLLQGDPRTALVEPFTLLLSETTARTLFGDEDALGKTIILNNDDAFTVTGVFQDTPHNTHLHFDALGSITTLARWFGPEGLTVWDSPNYATYVLLAEDASSDALRQKMPAFLEAHLDEQARRQTALHLQPVTDIHLHSHLVGDLEPGGDITYVYLFSAIAFFILLIACFNFMNLATARSAGRAREVGMRKAVGASRRQLIQQFLGESLLMAFLALVLALVLVELTLPAFSGFVGKTLVFTAGDPGRHLALLTGIGLLTGLLAGCYPAFFLSAFRPVAVLKGRLQTGPGRATFRSVLVIAQFTIAMVLLVCTLVVSDQLAYVRQKRLGLDAENVVVLSALREIAGDFEPFRNQLLQRPDILDVTQSNPVPSGRLVINAEAEASPGDQRVSGNVFIVFADAYFFPAYRIEFAAGRNFSPESATDAEEGFILNETAARQFGWADPARAIGQPFTLGRRRGQILGVAKDFHLESMRQDIVPMVFFPEPDNFRAVSVRFRSDDMPGLMAFLEDRWQTYEPNRPLGYAFLDERFGQLYETERTLGTVFRAFALLSLLITGLGLFGMVAFIAEQRTKEIGIRKVLGASVSGIVLMLTRQFSGLVALAGLVGTPIAYVTMHRWLDGFAYHVEISWPIFLKAGLAALLVALFTVSYQALKAALADPVQSLRYE